MSHYMEKGCPRLDSKLPFTLLPARCSLAHQMLIVSQSDRSILVEYIYLTKSALPIFSLVMRPSFSAPRPEPFMSGIVKGQLHNTQDS